MTSTLARDARGRGMGRVAFLLLCVVCLSGCDSEQKRRSIFMPRCAAAGFTVEQCDFLFAMSEKAASDSDDAAMLGMAVGISSGVGRK